MAETIFRVGEDEPTPTFTITINSAGDLSASTFTMTLADVEDTSSTLTSNGTLTGTAATTLTYKPGTTETATAGKRYYMNLHQTLSGDVQTHPKLPDKWILDVQETYV